MDMKFPRGRGTQLKKVMEIPGDLGRGNSEASWNGAESWEVGVKLNKTSVRGWRGV